MRFSWRSCKYQSFVAHRKQIAILDIVRTMKTYTKSDNWKRPAAKNTVVIPRFLRWWDLLTGITCFSHSFWITFLWDCETDLERQTKRHASWMTEISTKLQLQSRSTYFLLVNRLWHCDHQDLSRSLAHNSISYGLITSCMFRCSSPKNWRISRVLISRRWEPTQTISCSAHIWLWPSLFIGIWFDHFFRYMSRTRESIQTKCRLVFLSNLSRSVFGNHIISPIWYLGNHRNENELQPDHGFPVRTIEEFLELACFEMRLHSYTYIYMQMLRLYILDPLLFTFTQLHHLSNLLYRARDSWVAVSVPWLHLPTFFGSVL